ncbi:MAG: class I SAM-dependent methyltransferase [Bryobacteraceae bacterium]
MQLRVASSTLLLALAGWSPLFSQQFNKESLAPYIPSPQEVVDKMLEAGRVKAGDVVYDLGSGDGRVVITAAQKYHARAVGIELRADLCKSTAERVKELGLEDKITLIHGNLLNVDLSPADVVTLYLLTSSNERLRPRLEKFLKPGARVVSNDFEIRGWTANEVVKINAGGLMHRIYVYEVQGK